MGFVGKHRRARLTVKQSGRSKKIAGIMNRSGRPRASASMWSWWSIRLGNVPAPDLEPLLPLPKGDAEEGEAAVPEEPAQEMVLVRVKRFEIAHMPSQGPLKRVAELFPAALEA
jgi:hypothetical protein